jgi:hypothetical protein
LHTAPNGRDEPSLLETLARGLDAPPDPDTRRLAGHLAGTFGHAAVALLHYGSHAQSSGTEIDSAWDFFVVVDDYQQAYRSLGARLPYRLVAWRAALLNHVLPPNVISVVGPGPGAARTAKCCVLSLGDLARACSSMPRDHFVRARLFQHIQLVWARDEEHRRRVTGAVVAARRATFSWCRPFLPARFDPALFCRTLLDVSYAAEIRPEDDQRVEAVMAAQADTLVPMYDVLLAHLAGRGVLAREGDRYRDPRPPGVVTRALSRSWFGWSKLRATLRWAKYVALYDDWLDYVVRKIERRSGVSIEITPRERRWPLVFLWPKALRYLTRAGRRPGRP